MTLSIFSRAVSGASVDRKASKESHVTRYFSHVVARPSVDKKGSNNLHATQYIFSYCSWAIWIAKGPR